MTSIDELPLAPHSSDGRTGWARLALIAGLVVLLVGVGSIVSYRLLAQRSPYGPKQLAAQATLQLTAQATADAAMQPASAEHAAFGDQIFLGRVSWTVPSRPQPGGSLRIVLLDSRRHLLPGTIAVTSPRPDQVGTGSDPALDLAQQRYPWLQGVGARPVDGGFVTSGSVITAAVTASPVTFVAVLHPPADQQETDHLPDMQQPVATTPVATADLMVALISVGPAGQVYWAQRLLH